MELNILKFYPRNKFSYNLKKSKIKNFCYINSNQIENILYFSKMISKFKLDSLYILQMIINEKGYKPKKEKIKCPNCENKDNLKFLDIENFEIIVINKIELIDKIFIKCLNCNTKFNINSIYKSVNKFKKIIINNRELKNEIENLETSIESDDDDEDEDEEEEEDEDGKANKKNKEINYLLNTFIKKLNLFNDFIEKFNMIYQKYISKFLIIPPQIDKFIENFDNTIFGKYKPLLMKRKKTISENIESFYNIVKTQNFNKIKFKIINNHISESDFYYIPRIKKIITNEGNNIKLFSLSMELLFFYKLDKDSFYNIIFINKSMIYSKIDFIIYVNYGYLLFFIIKGSEIKLFGTKNLGKKTSFIKCIKLNNIDDKFVIFCDNQYLVYEITKENKIQLNLIYEDNSLGRYFIKSKNLIKYSLIEKNKYININTGKENKSIEEKNIPNSKIISLYSLYSEELELFNKKVKNELVNFDGHLFNYCLNYSYGNINGNEYIIIYDKLKVIYLFKCVNNNFELIKVGILEINFDYISFLDENYFLVSYVDEENFSKKIKDIKIEIESIYGIYENKEIDSIKLLLCNW